jgi:hypothetical protein
MVFDVSNSTLLAASETLDFCSRVTEVQYRNLRQTEPIRVAPARISGGTALAIHRFLPQVKHHLSIDTDPTSALIVSLPRLDSDCRSSVYIPGRSAYYSHAAYLPLMPAK